MRIVGETSMISKSYITKRTSFDPLQHSKTLRKSNRGLHSTHEFTKSSILSERSATFDTKMLGTMGISLTEQGLETLRKITKFCQTAKEMLVYLLKAKYVSVRAARVKATKATNEWTFEALSATSPRE